MRKIAYVIALAFIGAFVYFGGNTEAGNQRFIERFANGADPQTTGESGVYGFWRKCTPESSPCRTMASPMYPDM